MRWLIALLAAVALLVNPIVASAAQFACDHGGMAMAGMDQPQMAMDVQGMDDAQMAATPALTDPCCDHSGSQKTDDKSCAQACATTCAVLVGVRHVPASQALTLTWTRAPAPVVAAVWPQGHDPSGLERPPKPIP